jgi:hypothetical protein
LGKLHKERAMTGRIFQALPTQTNTTTVAFPGITENDLLWAGVCPALPSLFVTTDTQTDTMFVFIYRMGNE